MTRLAHALLPFASPPSSPSPWASSPGPRGPRIRPPTPRRKRRLRRRASPRSTSSDHPGPPSERAHDRPGGEPSVTVRRPAAPVRWRLVRRAGGQGGARRAHAAHDDDGDSPRAGRRIRRDARPHRRDGARIERRHGVAHPVGDRPSNAVDSVLWLWSDQMGFFAPTTPRRSSTRARRACASATTR